MCALHHSLTGAVTLSSVIFLLGVTVCLAQFSHVKDLSLWLLSFSVEFFFLACPAHRHQHSSLPAVRVLGLRVWVHSKDNFLCAMLDIVQRQGRRRFGLAACRS